MILLHTLNGLSFLGKLHLFTELGLPIQPDVDADAHLINILSQGRQGLCSCPVPFWKWSPSLWSSSHSKADDSFQTTPKKLSTVLCKLNYWRLMTVFLYAAWPRVVLKAWGCTRWLEMETPQHQTDHFPVSCTTASLSGSHEMVDVFTEISSSIFF